MLSDIIYDEDLSMQDNMLPVPDFTMMPDYPWMPSFADDITYN